MSFPSEDVCSLRIRIIDGINEKHINIHNVYSLSPESYSSDSPLTSVEMVKRLLSENAAEEHIILGDFNLHHPVWSGPARPTQHRAANQLLDVVRQAQLQLTLSPGTVTWEARKSTSTIDLVFMTDVLQHTLLHCRSRPEMNLASNHVLISIKLTLERMKATFKRKRAWKHLDSDRLTKALHLPSENVELNTTEDIETLAKGIQEAISKAIESTVPWAVPSPESKLY